MPPWIVTGVGGVAVVAGVVLFVAAPKFPAGCDRDTKICADAKDENKAKFAYDMPIAGAISLIGGGVLVAGGLLWHFLEPTGPVGGTAARLPASGRAMARRSRMRFMGKSGENGYNGERVPASTGGRVPGGRWRSRHVRCRMA